MRTFVLCRVLAGISVVLLLVTGCKSTPRPVSRHSDWPVSQAEAAEIARKHIREVYRWSDFSVSGIEYYQEGVWAVFVHRVPTVPDGHTMIEVSAEDGQLVHYSDRPPKQGKLRGTKKLATNESRVARKRGGSAIIISESEAKLVALKEAERRGWDLKRMRVAHMWVDEGRWKVLLVRLHGSLREVATLDISGDRTVQNWISQY